MMCFPASFSLTSAESDPSGATLRGSANIQNSDADVPRVYLRHPSSDERMPALQGEYGRDALISVEHREASVAERW